MAKKEIAKKKSEPIVRLDNIVKAPLKAPSKAPMIPEKKIKTIKETKEIPAIIPAVQKPAAVKNKVKKPAMQEVDPEHEQYFVYLKNPLDYRRHLLEGSRKILYCLKSHQHILIIRQKKLEEMKNLKGTIRELIYLNKKFNEKLPKFNMTFIGETPSEDKKKAAPVPVSSMPTPREEKSEMERLEDSLAAIERKIKSLHE